MKQLYYVLLVQIFHINSVHLQLNAKKNVARYDDPSITTFPSQASEYFDKIKGARQILFVNDTIYIGATNTLVTASADLRSDMKVIDIKPTASFTQNCQKNCENYATSLFLNTENKIVACGTRAGSPHCRIYSEKLKSEENSWMNGIDRYLKDVDTGVTSFATDKWLFVGSNDLLKIGDSKTLKPESGSLNTPNFVSSYKLDDSGYIYFLLTEISELRDRKFIFSRIVRVCEHDLGVRVISSKRFVSFLKAQMVCKKEVGEKLPPVYYDYLKSSVRVEVDGEDYIYAVFSSSSDVNAPSAVCRYRAFDIVRTFRNSELASINNNEITKKPFPALHQKLAKEVCEPGMDDVKITADVITKIQSLRKEFLLFESVFSYDNGQAIFTTDIGLTSIAVDVVSEQKKSQMLFLGATDGLVYKVFFDSSESRIVEYIQPFQGEAPIYNLKLNKGVIYAGGATGVSSFPVQRCSSFMMCQDCVSVDDPYCVWSNSSCTDVSEGRDENIKVSECPVAPKDYSCIVEKFNRGALECRLLSSSREPVSILGWTRNNKEVHSGDLYSFTNYGNEKSLLLVKNTNENTAIDAAGIYKCIVGNANHKKSCNNTIGSRGSSTVNPYTTGSISPPDTHASPATSTATNTRTDNNTDFTMVKPTPAPKSNDGEDSGYRIGFFATVGLLLLILPVLLILLICTWRRRHARSKNPHSNSDSNEKSEKVKMNGYSPSKSIGKDRDDSKKGLLSHEENDGAKKTPDVKFAKKGEEVKVEVSGT